MNHRFHVGESIFICYTGDGVWQRSTVRAISRVGGQQRYVVDDYLADGPVTLGREHLRPLGVVDRLAELA